MVSHGANLPPAQLVDEIADVIPGFVLTDRSREFSPSAHGVLSGMLDASEVVVKPFIGSVARMADHEARMLGKISEAGITTVTPTVLCFASLADYLITEYEGIQPLDQAGLHTSSDTELVQVADEVGKLIADLHGNGITHGDIQPKNLFHRRSDRRLGVLDPESAKHYTETIDEGFLQRCGKELADTFKMFKKRAVGHDRLALFRERVLAAYGEHDQTGLPDIMAQLELLENQA